MRSTLGAPTVIGRIPDDVPEFIYASTGALVRHAPPASLHPARGCHTETRASI